MAKESVVATLQVMFGSEGGVTAAISAAAAGALLIFCLLYTPCVAAVASIRREMGARWAFCVVLVQCLIAWVAAFGFQLLMMIF
jgi:ferrous iron transport protein B